MSHDNSIRKSKSQMIEEYESLVRNKKYLNDRISYKRDNIFRLMTYNVHGWADARYSDNKCGVEQLISRLKPDYVGLQEVIWSNDDTSLLEPTNYHMALAPTRYNNETIFGNACLSRPSINNVDLIFSKHSHEDRCFLFSQIEVDSIELMLGVIHCDHKSRQGRFRDIQNIVRYIQNYPDTPMILMGDFNAVQAEDYSDERYQELSLDDKRYSDFDTISYFHRLTNNTFNEAFEGKVCETSVWSNRRVDYIFYRNLPWSKVRSHIYYTDLSDHLPIIMDIYLK